MLQKINPKVEIRISATPKTNSDHKVTIDRQEVVDEEMIKKQVVRRENLQNVALQSYYSVYKSSDRNRLGPDFKKELIDCFSRNWLVKWQQIQFSFSLTPDPSPTGEGSSQSAVWDNRKQVEQNQHIKFDVLRLGVEVPENIVFQNEVGIINVEKNKHEFARSAGEVRRIYIDYCRGLLGSLKSHVSVSFR